MAISVLQSNQCPFEGASGATNDCREQVSSRLRRWTGQETGKGHISPPVLGVRFGRCLLKAFRKERSIVFTQTRLVGSVR